MRKWVGQHAVLSRSLAWGALGAICFVAAFAMTWSISHVTTALSATAPDRLEKDFSGWYSVAVIADAGTDGHVPLNFDYTQQDELAVLGFDLPAGARQLVIAANAASCAPETGGQLGAGLRIHENAGYRQFELPQDIQAQGGQVTCNLPARLLRNSFTTFASIFYNDPRGGSGEAALPLDLTLNSREGPVDVVASNSLATPGDIITLRPGGFVATRFESMHLGEVRDWYILIIGVLVGFGAAMLIEAFRPLIDRIGRHPEMTLDG